MANPAPSVLNSEVAICEPRVPKKEQRKGEKERERGFLPGYTARVCFPLLRGRGSSGGIFFRKREPSGGRPSCRKRRSEKEKAPTKRGSLRGEIQLLIGLAPP